MILVALLSLALVRQDFSPAVKRELPNGALLWAEEVPQSNQVSLQLWASSVGCEETDQTNGLRHLAEHLLARGKDGSVDLRLESVGGYLRARTFRDAMQFEINVPAKHLPLAVQVIREIVETRDFDEADIAREVNAVSQEIALTDDIQKLSRTAWTAAYGKNGLDPQGDLEVISKATPATMKSLIGKIFNPIHMAVVVSGPIKPSKTLGQLQPIFAVLNSRGKRESAIRGASQIADVSSDALGEARAVPVGPIDEPGTLCTLAAAMAIGGLVDNGFVQYTPTFSKGLIIVGQTESTGTIEKILTASDDGTRAAWLASAKFAATQWLNSQLTNPIGIGTLRGNLLCQRSEVNIEKLTRAIDQITWPEFLKSVEKFESKSVKVTGR